MLKKLLFGSAIATLIVACTSAHPHYEVSYDIDDRDLAEIIRTARAALPDDDHNMPILKIESQPYDHIIVHFGKFDGPLSGHGYLVELARPTQNFSVVSVTTEIA